MAISRESLITILYGANALNAPSDLSDGELAFSNGSKKLFVGSGGNSTPEWVGAIVEDESSIDWYGVSEENNKIATQKAILDLFPSGAISEIALSDKVSLANSDGSSYASIKSNPNSSQDVVYILPLSSGSVDQFLKVSSVSGSDVSLNWATISGGVPGGSDTYVQFNDSGSFGGDSGLAYNKSTDTLTVAGDIAVNGGDVTTSATTASLYDLNATTVNIARSSTLLTLGAASGVAVIRNQYLRLATAASTIFTSSGTSNSLTVSPYGNIILSPTSTTVVGGTRPTLNITNSDNAAGNFDFSGGDIYLGYKEDQFGTLDSVNIIFDGPISGNAVTLTAASGASPSTVTIPASTGTLALVAGSSSQIQYNGGGNALSASANLTFDGSNLKIGSQGDIRMADADSSHYVAFQSASSMSNNNIYTLPSSVGSAGQVLSISSVVSNDATLSWDDSVSSVNTLTGDVVLFHYQSSPPVSGIAPGSRWMDSSTGEEYVYINDGNSSQWIQPTLNPLFGTMSGAVTVVTTSSYSATDSDYYIGVDYAGTVTITLPAAPQTGRIVVVKDESGEASYVGRSITIEPDDVSDLIDNETSVILNIDNGSLQFIYRSGWRII